MEARWQGEALPLRGRDRERAVLEAAVADVAAGMAGAVMVEAPAGLGKTRLLHEASVIAAHRGVAVVSGGGDPVDRDASFVTLLRAMSSGPEPVLSRDDVKGLRQLLAEPYWLVLELGDRIEQAALRRPLVVTLDDLQWADPASLDALRTMTTGGAGAVPILWVMAHRPHHDNVALGRFVAELESTAKSGRILLDVLDEAAVAAIVSDLVPELSPAVSELAASADGVPFLLVELLRDLDRPASAGQPPGIVARVSRLSPGARRLAQVGAVLGRSFRADDAASMGAVSATFLLDPFDELVRADVLVPAGAAWSFRHDLIRQAVLDTLPEPSRQALERQAADVLLAAGIAPIDVARRLVSTAEHGDRRAIDTLAAAGRSLLVNDPSSAAELMSHALVLCPFGDERRVPLASGTIVALHLAGREVDALVLAEETRADVTEPTQLSALQLAVAKMYVLPATTRITAGRLGLDAAAGDPVWSARHRAVLVLSHTAAGELAVAEEVAAAADAAVADIDDPGAALDLAFSRMTLDEATARYDDALARVPVIRSLAASSGDHAPAHAAEWLRANVLVSLDRLAHAWDVSTAALGAAQRDRQAWIATRWEIWQGWYLLQRGRLAEARAVLDGTFVAIGLTTATALPDAVGIAALARVARHVGDPPVAARCAAIVERSLRLDTDDDARRHLAWSAVADAVANEDRQAVARAMTRMGREGAHLPVLAVDVGIELDAIRAGLLVADELLVARAAESAVDRARRNPGVGGLAAAAAHAAGLAAGDPHGVGDVVDVYVETSRPLLAVTALRDVADLIADRDRPAAVIALQDAAELATAIGASMDVARVAGRLEQLGVRRGALPRPLSGWHALTPTERSVALHVGRGMTNRAAADALFVSPHTIGSHLRRIFDKLAITSRVDLARIASIHDD